MDSQLFSAAINLRDSGQIDEALRRFELLERAARDADDKAALLANQATCLRLLGRLKQARHRLARGLTLVSGNNPIALHLRFLDACVTIDQGNLGVGIKALDKLVMEYGGLLHDSSHQEILMDILRRRAFALTKAENYVRALDEINILQNAKMDPEEAQELHFYAGVCYSELGSFDKAEEELKLALTLSIDTAIEVQARYRLALLYVKRGAIAKARLELEMCLPKLANADVPFSYIYELLSKLQGSD